MQYLGYDYRMTDIQAALVLSQLRKINSSTHFSPSLTKNSRYFKSGIIMASNWDIYNCGI